MESTGKIATSLHLESISDLTVAAKIKPGFVPAFESVTYEGRLRLALMALFKMRQTAREYYSSKPFVDTADRIQSLRSFRFAILPGQFGEPSRLLLAVTFDRAWEPYMRLIWRPLGNLLDVVFCNCEGYDTAFSSSFDHYAAWVRRNQAETKYFFASTGLSVGDLSYLDQAERLYRDGHPAGYLDCDKDAIRLTGRDPEKASAEVRAADIPGTTAMALEALGALYRLADYYPPNPENRERHGDLLVRATRDLLHGFNPKKLDTELQGIFAEEIAWWNSLAPETDEEDNANDDKDYVEKLKTWDERLPRLRSWENIQHGILDPQAYKGVTHGGLLLMRITDAAKARAFVGSLGVTPGGVEPTDGVYVNLAFTRRGLERIGMPPHELALLPKEFDEGPEDRAGLLGDVHDHHPRKWIRPTRWQPRGATPAAALPVELSEVDLVVQLRIRADGHEGHEIEDGHPLYERVQHLEADAAAAGVTLLAVEAMRRAVRDGEGDKRKEHFGFVDGRSQPAAPQLEALATSVSQAGDAGETAGDEVPLGELLWGYGNSRGDGPQPYSAWLDNGSFLVIRKMKQDVAELKKFVTAQAARTGLGEEELYARMMGRDRNGGPLVKGATVNSNLFDYSKDLKGDVCPFQSHVRRTNPRTNSAHTPVPRIMRRGMSYGPHAGSAVKAERGLYFMCYNASIAEQFEVIQRWINGANPTSVGSAQNDPLIGVGQPGCPRTFRFLHDEKPYRIPLDEPKGRNRFVQLQWGLYLFAPSLTAIKMIAKGPETWPQPQANSRTVHDEVKHGEAIIASLEQLPVKEAALGWKSHLEDFSAKDPSQQGDGPAIWAAIRARGGVMKVPYDDWTRLQPGELASYKPPEVVIVASKELVDEVLLDKEQRFSVVGEAERMKKSFGLMYVGLDGTDSRYPAESERPNEKLMAISAEQAFKVARPIAEGALVRTFDAFEDLLGARHGKVHLHAKFITPVLGEICRHWFGIPDDLGGAGKVVGGGWNWEKVQHAGQAGRAPRCPGDFMAPSRYIFYPDPLPSVVSFGQAHGQAMYQAVTEHFAALRPGEAPPGVLAKDLAVIIPYDRDLLVRTLIGIMTGFLPPADGCLKLALFGWLEEDELWRVQQGLASRSEPDAYERARLGLEPALRKAIQRRPAPDTLWRTAVKEHDLGYLKVKVGDRIIVGVGSAAAESSGKGICDVYPVFGGNRSAAPHPTHACPGYHFAFGTMLGILSALFERCEIKALPAPLMVEVTELPTVAQPAPPAPPARPD